MSIALPPAPAAGAPLIPFAQPAPSWPAAIQAGRLFTMQQQAQAALHALEAQVAARAAAPPSNVPANFYEATRGAATSSLPPVLPDPAQPPAGNIVTDPIAPWVRKVLHDGSDSGIAIPPPPSLTPQTEVLPMYGNPDEPSGEPAPMPIPEEEPADGWAKAKDAIAHLIVDAFLDRGSWRPMNPNEQLQILIRWKDAAETGQLKLDGTAIAQLNVKIGQLDLLLRHHPFPA